MILLFRKVLQLDGQHYCVLTNDETRTGTAIVRCRDEKTGELLDADNITVLCDADFAGTEDDVREEYYRLMRRKQID